MDSALNFLYPVMVPFCSIVAKSLHLTASRTLRQSTMDSMFLIYSSWYVVPSYRSICWGFRKPTWMCSSWILLVNGARETRFHSSEMRNVTTIFTLRLVLCSWGPSLFLNMRLSQGPWSLKAKTHHPSIGLRCGGAITMASSPLSFYLVFLHSSKTEILLLDHLVLVMQRLNDVIEHFVHFLGWWLIELWRLATRKWELCGLCFWLWFLQR